MTSMLRCLVPAAIVAAGLAACSSGATDSESQAAASVGAGDAAAASSGFNETDLSALRPETEESRETLWRLKGHTVQNQLRR